MDKELDLQHSLRPGLDILGNEIVISLKKRYRYKQNPEIYKPGLVKDHPQLSLLIYELARTEQLHAELGRYTYSDQESFTDVSDVPLIILRQSPPSPIRNLPTGKHEELINFYLGWITKYCKPGSDSDAYGEAVTTDVANLLNLLERVTLGKYVAESKFQKNREKFQNTSGEPEAIRKLIVHPEREQNVILMATKMAEHYEFDPEQARYVFRWLIDATVDVQVRYLQNRVDSENF